MSQYNPLLDSDQFHNTEILPTKKTGERTFVQVNEDGTTETRVIVDPARRVVAVNYEAAAQRNLGYVLENLRRRKEQEA